MKILIAYDGSSSSEAVIGEAVARPWPAGSEFALITALDPFFFTKAPLLLDEAKRSTEQALEEAAKPLQQAGWPVETNMVLENPRHAITRCAVDWKADLILLGSHGKSAFSRLLLGSTAQAVLRHAMCSVELVRGTEKEAATGRGMHILIPTDGSEDAEKAVKMAATVPWPSGTEARVISCPELPILIGEFPYYSPEQTEELAKSGEVHAKESVTKAAAVLAKTALKVSTEVTEPKDSPARAILEVADEWKADLIVMGSHGRRGLDRIVLGSVSESVALHARCSVEVVR
ncbi:MAG: universal stress protein [Candidatus Acidiferrum sp.]